MVLPNTTLAKIVVYREIGYSWDKIASKLGLKGRSTPRMAYNRYIKNKSLEPRKSTGRPRKITERGERYLVRWLEKDPFVTPERLQVLFNSFSPDTTVCEKTIRRLLRRRGYSGRAAAKKLLLSTKIRQKRVEWCRRHKDWTEEQWGRVLFSDEVRMRLRSDGRVYVWRKPGKRFDRKYTKHLSTDKRSLMFWGIISSTGQKKLVKCPPSLRSCDYLAILQEVGPEIFGQNLIFQQDNCSVHKARIIRNFLEESGVSVLQWPAYSPDLNIIENLWAIVKKRLRKERVTWENLEETVIRIWENFDEKIIKKLYQSMRSRLNACIKSGGATIGY